MVGAGRPPAPALAKGIFGTGADAIFQKRGHLTKLMKMFLRVDIHESERLVEKFNYTLLGGHVTQKVAAR